MLFVTTLWKLWTEDGKYAGQTHSKLIWEQVFNMAIPNTVLVTILKPRNK